MTCLKFLLLLRCVFVAEVTFLMRRDMGSGAVIYKASFIENDSDIQKLLRRNTQTHRQHGDVISLLLFF
jgi:hypothetical protein